jgi:hypothetical protein
MQICPIFDMRNCCRTIIAAMLSDGTIAQNAAQAAAFRSISGVQGVLDPQKRLEMVHNVAPNRYVDKRTTYHTIMTFALV